MSRASLQPSPFIGIGQTTQNIRPTNFAKNCFKISSKTQITHRKTSLMHGKFLFLITTHLKDTFQQICSFSYAIVETQKQNQKLLRDWAACGKSCIAVFPNVVTFQHEVLRIISTLDAGSLCPCHVTMAID